MKAMPSPEVQRKRDACRFINGADRHARYRQAPSHSRCTLAFMGIALDSDAHTKNLDVISAPGSKPILIVSADEEGVIRDLCLDFSFGFRAI